MKVERKTLATTLTFADGPWHTKWQKCGSPSSLVMRMRCPIAMSGAFPSYCIIAIMKPGYSVINISFFSIAVLPSAPFVYI